MKRARAANKQNNQASKRPSNPAFPFFDWESPPGHIVGARFQHFWAREQEWFAGRITRFNESTGHYLVKYDVDDEQLWLSLESEAALVGTEVKRTMPQKMLRLKERMNPKLGSLGSSQGVYCMACD